MQELIRQVLKVKEQLEHDAQARILAENKYLEAHQEVVRLTEQLKEALDEIEKLHNTSSST